MTKRICIVIMALVCTGAVFYGLWRAGAFLPAWISWESGTVCDRSGAYTAVLEKGQVTVLCDNTVIWNSPKEIKVQQMLFGDADNDQEEELLLLCWKIGRFGESRPFWMERDERNWSQHIYVYQCRQGKVKPQWMSSYIGQDVTDMSVRAEKRMTEDKREGDASQERNRLFLTDPAGKVSRWVWLSWGFTKEETEVSFVVFGDNLIHEPIYRYGLRHGGDFGFLYENSRELIDRNDVAVINQEAPLTGDPAMYGDYPRFGTPVQVGEAIVDAGFDVVTCGTNHALDRGAAGVNFTKHFFDGQGIVCLGIQSEEEKEERPYEVVTRNGIRFALFNYTYGTNGIKIPDECPAMVHLLEDEDRIREAVRAAKEESDMVIVFAHWGTEYAKEPDAFQEKWTQVFLESGVDAVIGTHPHTLQPYEMLQDGNGHQMLVYYSIGNFVSAQYEQACVKGGAAEFTVSLTADGYKITQYSLQPLEITHEKGKYSVAQKSIQ